MDGRIHRTLRVLQEDAVRMWRGDEDVVRAYEAATYQYLDYACGPRACEAVVLGPDEKSICALLVRGPSPGTEKITWAQALAYAQSFQMPWPSVGAARASFYALCDTLAVYAGDAAPGALVWMAWTHTVAHRARRQQEVLMSKRSRTRVLMVVDGNNVVHREYHAHKDLRTSQGVPTGAVFGFLIQMQVISEKLGASDIVVAFDKGRSFRKDLLPEYKANRHAPDDALTGQWAYVERLCDALGITRVAVDGYEADDVIATICAKSQTRVQDGKLKVVVVSGDKDMQELVRYGAVMYDLSRSYAHTRQEIIDYWGVEPELIRHVLALAGDASDGVKGVEGVGRKTAGALVSQYGSLEAVIDAAVQGKIVGTNGKPTSRALQIAAQADVARKVYEVLAPATNLELGVRASELAIRLQDHKATMDLLKELEFTSHIRAWAAAQKPWTSALPDTRADQEQYRQVAPEDLDPRVLFQQGPDLLGEMT